MKNDDLEAALACAALLEEKYANGAMTFELQAANSLRLLCDEVHAFRDEIAFAVAAEREACAKVCDDIWQTDGSAYDCREAIRARGETK
jgi:hypothetical protein